MTDEAPQLKPPYLPWTTFQNVTDELRGKGLPGKLDRTAIQGKSGSTQAHYLAALRYLGMLDSEDRPTERFKAYVTRTDQRPAMLADILQEKYAEALALGTNSTSAQLTSQFRAYGLEGETGRKAIAFFLNAARVANIKVSQYWPQTRPGGGGRSSGNGTAKPRKRTKAKARAEEYASPPTAPATDAKSRYIDLLLKKAEEQFDTDLLDRIEKVIGVGNALPAPAPASAPATGRGDEEGPRGGDDS